MPGTGHFHQEDHEPDDNRDHHEQDEQDEDVPNAERSHPTSIARTPFGGSTSRRRRRCPCPVSRRPQGRHIGDTGPGIPVSAGSGAEFESDRGETGVLLGMPADLAEAEVGVEGAGGGVELEDVEGDLAVQA